jgi:hypothetical protein
VAHGVAIAKPDLETMDERRHNAKMLKAECRNTNAFRQLAFAIRHSPFAI